MSKKQQQQPPPPEEPSVPLAVTGSVTKVVLKVIDSGLDWRVLAVLCGTFVAYVYSLPAEVRKDVKIGDFLSILAPDSSVWVYTTVGAVILLGAVMAVAVTVHTLQHQRIVQQGGLLKRLRAVVDQKRLSSDDIKALEQYASQEPMKSKEPVKSKSGGT